MKKVFKPASLAFNFLVLILFFIVGMYVAKITGAGKNQGLAGGAIVFGWGVLFAGIAFIASFFATRYVAHRTIVRLNWLLLVIALCTYGYARYSYVQKQKEKELEDNNQNYKPKPTTPTEEAVPLQEPTAMLDAMEIKSMVKPPIYLQEKRMGMGFFSPNFYENPVLYFYGNLTTGKSLNQHIPYDSLTVKRNQYNQFEIATAPPWLVPEYMKLDYDMFYFKVKSVSQEYVEVVTNETNQQTSIVNRRDGNFQYWPDFLLGVHSVEFLPESKEKVKVKPLGHAGENNQAYSFMHPKRVLEDWMHVDLLNNDFKKVGDGWIQWKRDGQLLILYNMLS